MCIASLNVALQPCSHRWYSLAQPCSPTTDLATCPDRIKLQGVLETRVETCPWCSDNSNLRSSTHRLVSGCSSFDTRRRSDSTTASTSNTSISPSDGDSDEDGAYDRAEDARLMNRRLAAYIMTAVPEEIPSRKASMIGSTQPSSERPALKHRESNDSGVLSMRRSSLNPARWGSIRRKKKSSI